jgi:hypothetical protein
MVVLFHYVNDAIAAGAPRFMNVLTRLIILGWLDVDLLASILCTPDIQDCPTVFGICCDRLLRISFLAITPVDDTLSCLRDLFPELVDGDPRGDGRRYESNLVASDQGTVLTGDSRTYLLRRVLTSDLDRGIISHLSMFFACRQTLLVS